ncbi:hypothetical protein LPB138_01955 [Urechidicola croceus]|uniref:O-antigen ligase-related domain-containing protein n=1 Tax=Urechidicola croceus TaxID=1850246 RepID=A0A1D8PBN9_9FLAO|nr:hypothetical protein LPB138_01955 [Urechidicola croceus]
MFVIFHLVLGLLLLNQGFAKIYAVLIVCFGFIHILKSKNSRQQAVLWSAYLAGSDVLFRMSKGMIFHELHKYVIAAYLILALIVEKDKKAISPIFIFYILLLLIGIAFSEIPYPESIRKAIAFNLSGPISLGLISLYFYKRSISIKKILEILFFLGLPSIAMMSLLYFKTPDIRDIVFGGVANFAASGGFGPNQVSTVLGVGAFALAVHILFKRNYTTFLIFDVILLIYIFYRNLLTFSRGGFLTAVFALVFFATFFIYSKRNRLKSALKYIGIVCFFGLALWLYTSDVTGGMIDNRYSNRNASGIKKEDVTSGRTDIFDSELEGLFQNPIFGMGVGSGKYKRIEETGIVIASHNEMSRLLGEHGTIGILILLILFVVPIFNAMGQPPYAIAFLGAFFIFWFLTINHSAMRVSFPGFIYGLSLIRITLKDENTLHR